MDIIRRSKIYYWLRWFGLDTVLAVSWCIWWLCKTDGHWERRSGLALLRFYMLDRLGDVIWEGGDYGSAYLSAVPIEAWISLVGLGGVSFLFWCVLPG